LTRLRSGLSHEVANSWLSAVARDCVLLDRSSRRGHPHPQGWFTGVPQVSSPASSESTAPLTWGVGAPRYSCAAPIPRVAPSRRTAPRARRPARDSSAGRLFVRSD